MKDETEKYKEEEDKEQEKVYTPTFMYFVSKSDAEYEKTMGIIEELKKEYDGKVVFDIKDVDKEPELKESFPVDGETPALIMLNIHNDISGFEYRCNDKEKLIQCIENSFNN